MEIRTFTTFWNMEKKLYSIYDLQLPFPIPIRSVIVFGAVGLPYWFLLNIFGLEFGLSPTVIIWVVPPIFIAFIADKPIFQGKNIIDFMKSTSSFLMESKTYKGLAPATEKYGANDYYEKTFYEMESKSDEYGDSGTVKADNDIEKRNIKLWRKIKQTEES
jgi:hypothetical protein